MQYEIEFTEEQVKAIQFAIDHPGIVGNSKEEMTVEEYITRLITQRLNVLVARYHAAPH